MITLKTFFVFLFSGLVLTLITPEQCYDNRIRTQDPRSFLVCEGLNWSAPHIILPMIVTFWIQHIWVCLLIPGLFEVFEQLMFFFFDGFVFFKSGTFESETIQGSLLGDWFFNGFIGVFLAFSIIAITKVPPLLSSGKHIIWLKYLLILLVFALTNLIAGTSTPEDCATLDPLSCNNVGLIIIAILLPFYLIAFYYACSFEDDEIYLWKGYPRRARITFFVLWFLVEESILIQNMQHYVPLYLGDAGGFYQPWLSCGFWFLLFLILAIRFKVTGRQEFDRQLLGNEKLKKKSVFFNSFNPSTNTK
jgi:hypothetical protein